MKCWIKENGYMTRKIIIASFFITLGLVMISFSQNKYDAAVMFGNQLGFGTRALGMGGAYSAVADDYSASYWNPAGLAQIRRREVWLSVSYLNLNNDFSLNGNSITATSNTTKFNSVGLVYPVATFKGSLVVALGYQQLKDFDFSAQYLPTSDQGNTELSFRGLDPNQPELISNFYGAEVQKEGSLKSDGSINQFSMASAVGITSDIFIGITLNFWSGKSSQAINLVQTDAFNNFQTAPADFDQYSEENTTFRKYSSFNGKFGTLMRLGRLARVAIGMEFPQTFYIEDEKYFYGQLHLDDGQDFYFNSPLSGDSLKQEYEVKIPLRLTSGAAITLRNLILSGSAEFINWPQYKFSNGARSTELLSNLTEGELRPTLVVRTGAELRVPFLNSQFRAGAIYDPSPFKNQDMAFDRIYATLGYGLLVNHMFKLDLAYMLGFWKQYNTGAITRNEIKENILYQKLFLNLSYRF